MLQKRRVANLLIAIAFCFIVVTIALGVEARAGGDTVTFDPLFASYDKFLHINPLMPQSTATVSVDCAKGESINKALEKSPQAQRLTIEIRGLCSENVVVTRDRVTLRGANPANDGIQAEVNAEIMDVSLWVRGAQLVTVENLKLTGGFSGVLATDTHLTHLRLINCRLEGNNAYGAQLQNSLIEATDTTFANNGNVNAGVFSGSRLGCTRCTFADPQGAGPLGTLRFNVFALTANRLVFFECTLTNGGIQSDDSLVFLTDSSITAFVPGGISVGAVGASSVVLTRVQLTGGVNFSQGTSVQLLGVTQAASPTPFNLIDDNAFVRIGDASPATGGPPSIASVMRSLNIRNFSNASLLQTSQISGNLNCSIGANAFCSMPLNVSGTSTCGLCPKP
jgi:hypothetical protein